MQDAGPNETAINFLKGFENFASRAERERKLRIENGKEILSFGVPFLDECLGGILKNDLILVGAKTGFGKSQLASLIAMSNVKQGKRVHFLALEAEEFEIERRIKYQFLAERFYADPNRPQVRLNYLDWYSGRLDSHLELIENQVQGDLKSLSNFNVFYRTGNFGVKDFERLMFGIKAETDLVIVDHLHYFDFDDSNENKAVKEIVKSIRDCALITGKPIILIAHVRKSDKRFKQLIPDIEDFHGSSDIGKIATKAITVAPCYDETETTHRKTYMQAIKCRIDGARTNMTGLLAFNVNHHKYERGYYLGKVSSDGSKFESFNLDKMPYWAINGLAGKEV